MANDSIHTFIAELERYNKKHKTSLTYGQFENMLYLEKLKKKKKKGRK